MKRKYTIEVDEDQAQAISVACEFMGRIAMGQFTEIATGWMFNWKVDHEQKNVAEKILQAAKGMLTDLGRSHPYYSISSPEVPDQCRIAYDLHQVIRHRLAWDRSPVKEITNCHKDEPMRYGKSNLATIQEVE